MNEKGLLETKSFSAAVEVFKFSKLLFSRNEYECGRQILRSGTSVGANIREAKRAESESDYIHKLSISQKECEETLYWLELLLATQVITKQEFELINQKFDEVMRILTYTLVKLKSKK